MDLMHLKVRRSMIKNSNVNKILGNSKSCTSQIRNKVTQMILEYNQVSVI